MSGVESNVPQNAAQGNEDVPVLSSHFLEAMHEQLCAIETSCFSGT